MAGMRLAVWLGLALLGCTGDRVQVVERAQHMGDGAELGMSAETERPIQYVCREPVDAEPGDLHYEFLLDGVGIEPNVKALAGGEDLVPGSIVHVHEFAMILGPPGRYEYFSPRAHADELELSFEGGPRRLVALRVGRWPRPAPRADGGLPLATTEPIVGGAKIQERPRTDLQDLRGLVLDHWDDAIAGVVATLDGSQLFIEYTAGVALEEVEGARPIVPLQLPADLRALRVEVNGPRADADARVTESVPLSLVGLERLADLRSLEIDHGSYGSGDHIDAAALARLTTLERLELGTWPPVRDSQHLSGLTRLRALDLSWRDEIVDLDFARELPALRWLDVRNSGVTTLAPLAGHPTLAVVLADVAPVRALPEPPPPGLRMVSIQGTQLDDEAVERLAAAAPWATIHHRWNQTLADVVACATRIHVRTRGRSTYEERRSRSLFVSDDPAVVRELLLLLRIDEARSGYDCLCDGTHTIELYRGDALLAALAYHYRSVGWRGWPSNGGLADPEGLCKWLEGHGVAHACSGLPPL